MSAPILIIGSEGSMGKRYQAVLRYLGHGMIRADKDASEKQVGDAARKAAGIIICTPTDTHSNVIKAVLGAKKPILCEKPVCKDLDQLHQLMSQVDASNVPFRMVMQYEHLLNKNRIGRSFYDYFRTGNDGIFWDCLQIIAFARGELTLRNVSPIWSCMINGQSLKLSDMDAAYIAEVQRWMLRPKQETGEIYRIHDKVERARVKGIQVVENG